MGLLFVHEDDFEAKGINYNMLREDHTTLLSAARVEHGKYPLIRRLNDFYGDIYFELDELQELNRELSSVNLKNLALENFKEFVSSAIKSQVGVQTIAD